MPERYRILVVDDSAPSREALKAAIESEPRLEVVAAAVSSDEAVELSERLRPDLITVDLHLPGAGALKAIERLLRLRPTPIVAVSARSSNQEAELGYDALSRGALETVSKSAIFSTSIAQVRQFSAQLRLLIEASRLPSTPPSSFAPDSVPLSTTKPLLVGFGASTGGPRALAQVLGRLPRDFPLPIVVVQHMAEGFVPSFVRFLSAATPLDVRLATADSLLVAGCVYVAPPKCELFVRETLTVALVPPSADALLSPTVDSLFFSMASSLKERAVGVLLTGMGADGAQGLLRLRRAGARTVVQDRASSAIHGMPQVAIALGAAEAVASLDDLAAVIARMVRAKERTSGTFTALRRRVLVVDDDPHALAVTKRHLENAGYEVSALDNPLLTASTLRRQHADLLVLESELKTTQGPVVTRALKDHDSLLVPVLVYSALDSFTLERRVRECGAALHATKSADGVELIRAVDTLLGRRRGAG